MRQHDKLINLAVKEILAPYGMFKKGSFRIWLDDNGYYNYCTETILPAITVRESAQDMVLKMIKRWRDYFSSKPSYKKMNKADFLPS